MSRDYLDVTYDMFMSSLTDEAAESTRFGAWVREVEADGAFGFEARHTGAQRPEVDVVRTDGEPLRMLNLSTYNYLGLGYHPDVIAAATEALQRHGLGAGSSPVHSGTLSVHAELERALVDFVGLPDRAVTLFSSGYGVNTGTISALMRRHHHVVMDRAAHMSILEGAQLSRAHLHYFEHNDPDDLERVLAGLPERRTLVCTEGVFSADGDLGALADVVRVAKTHGAWVLVDEAHSFGVAGPAGRGVAEAAGVLDQVDLLVVTFSKALGGVGGAVITTADLARYIGWYARCRMFSCAIDPAVTAGVAQGVRILGSPEGAARRARVIDNAERLRARLRPHVDLGLSDSWIVTVTYGEEALTIPLLDHLQRRGLDASVLQFPAVPVGEARIRLFVTSEHTPEQLDRAAALVVGAAQELGFALGRTR
jgi:glycine C-acetyltransferase